MEEKSLTHGIKFKEKFGYALGDMGGIMTFSLVSAYLQMFYTDSLHIPLAKITVLMLVARIWDAFNDPMWGAFIDSRKPTKHGRFRPYIFWSSVPLAIFAVLMFTKIPGLTDNQYLIYAYVTYILYGMAYTCVNIPYGSLASVITDDGLERSSLSMFRSVGAGFGGLPAQILLPLLIYSTVAGTDKKALDSTKLFFCVLCIAIVSLCIFAAHYKMTKERVVPTPKQLNNSYSPAKAMRTLLKNKPFIVVCLVAMLLITFQMYTQTSYNYLLKNYYGKPGLYSLVTVCTYVPMAIFLPFMSKLIKRFGKKETCASGLAFAAAINFLMFFMRYTPLCANPYVFLVLVFFSGMGQTFLVFELWALVMDTIDYHELLSGRREEGTSYAVCSFVRKIGQTAAGAGSSAILLAIGYDVNASDVGQSREVLDRLYDITTLVPAIILLIMFLLLAFCYKLSKQRLVDLHEKLKTVRNAEEY